MFTRLFRKGLAELLEQRGLLDETLVVALGEMGRTPKANANWGRDHWSTLFPAVLVLKQPDLAESLIPWFEDPAYVRSHVIPRFEEAARGAIADGGSGPPLAGQARPAQPDQPRPVAVAQGIDSLLHPLFAPLPRLALGKEQQLGRAGLEPVAGKTAAAQPGAPGPGAVEGGLAEAGFDDLILADVVDGEFVFGFDVED